MEPSSNRPTGLRERKKQKTRAAIQEHAMRLFREQGYGATTVEQIAAATEISPSTFFRYFPTKEDVVVGDVFEEMFLQAVIAQPPELNPIEAVHQTFHAMRGMLTPEQLGMEQERLMLVMATPELRARFLGNYAEALRKIAGLIAIRKGLPQDSYDAYVLSGALLGVGLAAMVAAFDQAKDYFTLFEEGLNQLAGGLSHLLGSPSYNPCP